MNAERVAVTSRSFSKHPVLRSALLRRHESVSFNDAGLSLAGDDLIEFLRGHTKAITALEHLDARVFEAVPELRVVSKYGVGLDMIDLRAMERLGVRLGWTGGVNRRSVAELVIAFAISLLHRLPAAAESVRGGKWAQVVGRQITGRTVGVVGCGHIGKDVSRMFRAFDCEVLAHDIQDFPEFYRAHGVTPVDLHVLLARADVVTLHLPLDESTKGILGPGELAAMKHNAVLINAARGQLVDETALKDQLKTGHIAGAAFDVFATEPPTDLELIRLANFVATPHIGGSTEEAILAMGRAAIEGLERATPVIFEELERIIAPGVHRRNRDTEAVGQ